MVVMFPRVIAFDVDGVLIDTDALHEDVLNAALYSLAGFRLTHEEHLTVFKGLPTREKLRQLVATGRLDPDLVESVEVLKQNLTADRLSGLPSNRAAVTLCEVLAACDFQCAAVSNARARSVRAMVAAAGVLPWMQFLLSNEDAAPKPAPDLYLEAARRFGVDPTMLTVIEDGAPGIAAARAAGCRLIPVRGPHDVGVQLLPRVLGGVTWT